MKDLGSLTDSDAGWTERPQAVYKTLWGRPDIGATSASAASGLSCYGVFVHDSRCVQTCRLAPSAACVHATESYSDAD